MSSNEQVLICKRHKVEYGRHVGDYCHVCVTEYPSRVNPDEMTGKEREEEMKFLGGPATMPFRNIHERIIELVGRDVYTHEIGLCWDGLVAESASDDRGTPKTIDELMQPLIETGKPVIAVHVSDQSDS